MSRFALFLQKVKFPNRRLFRFIWLLIFGLVIFSSIFPNGNDTRMGITNLPLNASPQEIRAAWGPGDAGSLMEVALTWSKFEQLDPTTQFWIVRLWSPGLSVIEVPLIWIDNLVGVPMFYSILLLTLSLLLVCYFIFRKIAQSGFEKMTIHVTSIILLYSWDFRYFLRDGIFYTEGIGYALLIAGLGLITLNVLQYSKNSAKTWIVSGLLIGISIWVRHVSDPSLILLIILSTFLLIFLVRKQKRIERSKKRKKGKRTFANKKIQVSPMNQKVQIIFATAIVALAITLPWRYISNSVYQGAPLMMSSAPGMVGDGLWIDGKKNPDFYWLPYNMNWACNIDIAKCNLINEFPEKFSSSDKRFEAVKSALANPVDYVIDRGKFLKNAWIPGFTSEAGYLMKVAGWVPILLIFISIYFFSRIRSGDKWLVMLIWAPFLLIQTGQLLLIHFESRYFIPVRLLVISIFLILLNLYVRENPKMLIRYENYSRNLRNWIISKVQKSNLIQ